MLPSLPQQPLGRVDKQNQLVRITIMKCETCGTKQKATWFVLSTDERTGENKVQFFSSYEIMEANMNHIHNIDDYGMVEVDI